jgi:hypothetical protein
MALRTEERMAGVGFCVYRTLIGDYEKFDYFAAKGE